MISECDNSALSAPTRPALASVAPASPSFVSPIRPIALANWFLAMTVLTTPIQFHDPSREFCRPSSPLVVSFYRRRPGRRVSAHEARQIVLQVYAEARQRLQKQRVAEARFLESLQEDGNVQWE